MNAEKDILALLAMAKMTKNKAMLVVLLALLAFAGNASAYTYNYTGDDVGYAIVELFVTFLLALVAKSPMLAGLIVILLVVSILGAIVMSFAGIVGLVTGAIKLPKFGKG
jgi:glucan phosphoethanolaminetransferase (alkaline phosphatase superfamily)